MAGPNDRARAPAVGSNNACILQEQQHQAQSACRPHPIVQAGLSKWLRIKDIVTLLTPETTPLSISTTPPINFDSRPPSGTLLLYHRLQTKEYRIDGYSWLTKKDANNVREDYVMLRLDGKYRVRGAYAKGCGSHIHMHRRAYYLLNEQGERQTDYILLHYLDTDKFRGKIKSAAQVQAPRCKSTSLDTHKTTNNAVQVQGFGGPSSMPAKSKTLDKEMNGVREPSLQNNAITHASGTVRSPSEERKLQLQSAYMRGSARNERRQSGSHLAGTKVRATNANEIKVPIRGEDFVSSNSSSKSQSVDTMTSKSAATENARDWPDSDPRGTGPAKLRHKKQKISNGTKLTNATMQSASGGYAEANQTVVRTLSPTSATNASVPERQLELDLDVESMGLQYRLSPTVPRPPSYTVVPASGPPHSLQASAAISAGAAFPRSDSNPGRDVCDRVSENIWRSWLTSPRFDEREEREERATLSLSDISSAHQDVIPTGTADKESRPAGEGAIVPSGTMLPVTSKHMLSLDLALERLPLEQKRELVQAQETCPHLVSALHKILLLRYESLDVEAAALKFCLYWKMRVELFGTKAFLPLSLKDALRDDINTMQEINFCRYLPGVEDRFGRGIMAIDGSRYDMKIHDADSVLRSYWYMFEMAIRQMRNPTKGVVILNNMSDLVMDNMDKQLISRFYSVEQVLPIKIRAYHYINPPWFFDIVYPVVRLLSPRQDHYRRRFHQGSGDSLLLSLSRFGIASSQIPSEWGGCHRLDVRAWLAEQQFKFL